MSKAITASFTRRMPDHVTEQLVAVLSSRASFEFKPLFDIILLKLRERNAASGGEEMLRLRVYEKLQGLVGQGAVNQTATGTTKKYKGVGPRMNTLRAEMKVLRAEWAKKVQAKAAARRRPSWLAGLSRHSIASTEASAKAATSCFDCDGSTRKYLARR